MEDSKPYDCEANPANITRLFRDRAHLEEIVAHVLGHVGAAREDEVRLSAQCDDFIRTVTWDDADGYSDERLVAELVAFISR